MIKYVVVYLGQEGDERRYTSLVQKYFACPFEGEPDVLALDLDLAGGRALFHFRKTMEEYRIQNTPIRAIVVPMNLTRYVADILYHSKFLGHPRVLVEKHNPAVSPFQLASPTNGGYELLEVPPVD